MKLRFDGTSPGDRNLGSVYFQSSSLLPFCTHAANAQGEKAK